MKGFSASSGLTDAECLTSGLCDFKMFAWQKEDFLKQQFLTLKEQYKYKFLDKFGTAITVKTPLMGGWSSVVSDISI